MGKALKKAVAHATKASRTQKPEVRLIQPAVSIHDRTQIEMVFSYSLNKEVLATSQDEWEFSVDAFMFLAPQMRITPESYPKERFYEDLQVFIRLREPRLTFKQLMGFGRKSSYSPLRYVQSYLAAAKDGNITDDPQVALEEIKVFGCSYVSYFLRRVEKHRERHRFACSLASVREAERLKMQREAMEDTLKLINRAYRLLHEWRSVLATTEALPPKYLESLKRTTRLVSEYCAYGFRDGLLFIQRMLDENAKLFEDLASLKLRRRIKALLRHERWYARRAGIYWTEEGDAFDQLERYVLRRSELKRSIWRVLYLNVRSTKIFRMQRQFGAMIAAAMAGTWAFIAQLIIWNTSSFDGYRGHMEGISAFLVVTAFVMAYVLKDRIKELGRSYFQRGFLSWIPDFANQIHFMGWRSKRTIGKLREKARIVHWNALPEFAKELHDEHLGESMDTDDRYANIIHYKKVVTLDTAKIHENPQPVRAIHDIIRINVHSFLQRLDDPLQKAVVVRKDLSAVTSHLPKVYPLDLVLRFSARSGVKEYVGYDVIRLFLTKDGLARVEQVMRVS